MRSPDPRFPSRSTPTSPCRRGRRETAYKAEIKRADQRLNTLAELIEQVLADLATWQAKLRSLEADGKPILIPDLRRRCVHQAALWQLLAHWFEARDAGACDEAEQELRTRAARAPVADAALNGRGHSGSVQPAM